MNKQQAINELSQVNLEEIIKATCKKFTDACYDQGLTVEKTQQLMYSEQGLQLIAELAAKEI